MRSSTTPPATSDAPAAARGVRAGALSPVLLLGAKIVLGIAGFGAFALLGAGGALVFKHFAAPAPHAGPVAAQGAPAIRARAASAPAAPPALPIAVPARPVQVDAAAPQASATPALVAAQAAAPAIPGSADAAIEISPRAGASSGPVAAPRVAHRTPDGGNPSKVPSARADKARCLATVNAITADLSLRNEAPTPQQLAILKRGCK